MEFVTIFIDMPILAIRHGLSHANNRDNIGTLAFASEQARLMCDGYHQARAMGKLLIDTYDIDVAHTPVAASRLLRTQQTAVAAGFLELYCYPQLDEVKHGMDLLELRTTLDSGKLPPAAIAAAEQTLANPPRQDIWITHGLRIAALCAVLGVHQNERLIPRFCEVRELPI